MTESPEVTQTHIFDMQVCVPEDWTDEQVVEFANTQNPCGTKGGWEITREGDKYLAGAPERVACEEEARTGFVHVMLHA